MVALSSLEKQDVFALLVHSFSLCSRHESYLAKAASMPDAEDQSMMGRFVRVERQVRSETLCMCTENEHVYGL